MRRSFWLAIILFVFIIGIGSFLGKTDGVRDDKEGKLPEEPSIEPVVPDDASEPPKEIPIGILVEEIPKEADIIFVSMRYVLNDLACLDDEYRIKPNWLGDIECLELIYNEDSNVLASPRQLYTLDIETGDVVQLTNVKYDFSSVKPLDSTRLMAIGAGEDTDGDGIVSTSDEIEIYLIDLELKEVQCLTEELELTAYNNPDYNRENELILFSAQKKNLFHNYLFTLSLDGQLVQVTDDDDYFDFDCSWSEDGSKIVFNRLPTQEFPWVIPAGVWLMDSDGSDLVQITEGGPNPKDEGPLGPYPIGVEADPDLSTDNHRIVFSRLKTGMENEPFGVWELVVIDVESGVETVLDSSYANMIPEWKEPGIVFIRQISEGKRAMDRKQSMYIYVDGEFSDLEPAPCNVFPIGSNGASWIE